jgi:protein-S-isoprenylcysteine O-methyltransferase Ste14
MELRRGTAGWLFVLAQVALFVAIAVVPRSDDWPTPAWVLVVSAVLTLGGFGLVLAASLRLGHSLTPTPVPTDRGALTTGGLYRFVRHPIYSGALAIVLGVGLRSGNRASVPVALLAIVFFDAKARWEERLLSERYVDYADYAARTPRFVPRLAGRRARH